MAAAISVGLLLFSLAYFISYTVGDGISPFFETILCVFPLFVVLLVTMGISAISVAGLVRLLEEPMPLRAAYFLLLYPVVLGGFFLASLLDGMVPSMIFGWPLFLAGAILTPYCAVVLRRGVGVTAEGGRAMIVCYNCGETLLLRSETVQIRCPRCGALNMNPFQGMPPLPPPPGPV